MLKVKQKEGKKTSNDDARKFFLSSLFHTKRTKIHLSFRFPFILWVFFGGLGENVHRVRTYTASCILAIYVHIINGMCLSVALSSRNINQKKEIR